MAEPQESIRRALSLVIAVADGADDDEIAPPQLMEAIEAALSDAEPQGLVRRHLEEARDGVSDGMPAEFVATRLYAALRAVEGV